MLFRKKPVEIEAVQWTGDNLDEVIMFCNGNATYQLMARGNTELVISTLEDGEDAVAQHVASRGDWIIRGVQGEYYPCKPDIFEQTYEPVDPKETNPNSAIYQVAAKEMAPLFDAFIDQPTPFGYTLKRDNLGRYTEQVSKNRLNEMD